MPQVAPFFIIKSQVVPFFIVTWPPNLFSSDTFKGISGPDSDSKLAPNIIDKYTEVARSITNSGGEAASFPANLANASAPHEIVERVLSRFGRIDVLINDAA